MNQKIKPILLILFIILVDQVSKFAIKLNMTIGESIHIFDWFQILFIENPGMAFGITLGSKSILTFLRIILIGLASYYFYLLIRDNYKMSYVYVIALIIAGAAGNIVDCLFYGLIFDESTPFQVASLLPEAGGYASFLHGKVVDMLYFPLFDGNYPSWVPWVGGDHFIFFSPVFNLADSAITVGIFILLIFFRKDFNDTFDLYFSKKK